MKPRWNIDQMYLYLVCFVTLIMMIVGITSVVRAAIQIAIPIPEAERPYYSRERLPHTEDRTESTLPEALVEDEAARQSTFNEDVNRMQALYRSLLMLIRGFVHILVAAPVYVYHWRQVT